MDISVLISAIPNVGLAVLLVLIAAWVIVQVVIPAIIARDKESRDYYIAEIKALRDESRQDKQLMFEAFKESTAANTKLATTLDSITDQLHEMNTELSTVRSDLVKLYQIVGKQMNLIEE
jgi:hypothetical protein